MRRLEETTEGDQSMTNNVLDIHDRQNPLPWWRRRRSPSALELAVAALEECRRDRLHHAQLAEYHAAMLKMLEQRDKRLQEDIKRLSEEVRKGDTCPTSS